MLKKISSLSIAILTAANAFATNVWDGSVATTFTAGKGTVAEPYQISNGAELALFAQKVSAGDTTLSAVLTDDIYLNEGSENYAGWGENPPVNHWSTPIGLYQKQYQGVFDGKGHKVYGAYLDTGLVTGYNGIGFFGTIGASATVKNLSIEQSYFAVQGEINVNPHVAIFVGILAGGKLTNVSANGFVYSNVNNTTTSAKYSEIGCLVGYASGRTIINNAIGNCKIESAIEKGSTGGNYHSVGGLIGKLEGTSHVENVYARSSVKNASKTAIAGLYLGGIVGNVAKATDSLYNAYYNISEVGESNAPQSAVGTTTGVRNNVLGKLTGNMKSEDFANILGTSFTYTATQNDGYPQLVVFEGNAAFEGGDGSEEKPFLIGSAKSLRAVSGLVNGMNDEYASKSYRMVADVVLNEGDDVSKMTYLWEPVGESDQITFQGRFDGAGKSIYGLIVPGKYTYAGLFGVIGASGIVENLSIRDSKINGIAVAGAFAGWNFGTVRYCSNYALVDSYSTSRHVYSAGIIAGIREGGRVEYCTNYGKIHADAAGATLHGYAAGIASENKGFISQSKNDGEIACDAYAGGIVSRNEGGLLENCINTGKVDSQNKALAAKYNDSNMAKYSSAGGICAINKANSTVTNSYSISNAVIGSKIAQIVAENSGTIDNCYFASGLVSGANVYSANSGTVSNSSAELVGRMKTGAFALVLGSAYKQDDAINDGYPIFLAEGETFGSANLFEGGDGSEGKPFLIATATQLRNMEYLVNKKNKEYGASHYKLIADISLNENSENYTSWNTTVPANTWTPMGSDTTLSFKGVFNGDNHSISGIYTNAKFSGLFGVIGASGIVKNVTIKQSLAKTTTPNGGAGLIAGSNFGIVDNVINEGNVWGNITANGTSSVYSYLNCGGVVGFTAGTVSNAENSGSIRCSANGSYELVNAGGLVGYTQKGHLKSLKNSGSITTYVSGNNAIVKGLSGGILGLGEKNGIIEDVVNSGTVYAKGKDTAKVAPIYVRIGGIIGQFSPDANDSAVINRAINTGNLEGVVSSGHTTTNTENSIGGIIGKNYGGIVVVRNSKNLGDIKAITSYAMALTHIGGIYGFDQSGFIVENCYAIGKYTASTSMTASPKTAKNFVGGLGGVTVAKSFIRGSYFAGTLTSTISGASTSTNNKGGIVGNNAGTIVGSYFDQTVAGFTNVTGANTGALTKAQALTTENMQTNEFAWKLNTFGADSTNMGAFTRYNDYPEFGDDSHLPIYRVVFDDAVDIYNIYTSYSGYVKAPADPEPAPGEMFVGWTDGDKYMLQNRQVIDHDMTLHALFTLVTEPIYSITFVDGSDVYVKATETTGMLKTLPTAKNIPMGYHFDGWFDNETNQEITTETIFTGITTVVAKYSANLYKITFLDYDGTEISSNNEAYGQKPKVPAAPSRAATDEYAYSFIGWDRDVVIVTEEATYTAVYDSTEVVYSSSSVEHPKSSSSEVKSSSSVTPSSSSVVPASSSSSVVVASSSSVEPPKSSSSEVKSSSSVTPSSSSVVPASSSSSVVVASSSSVKPPKSSSSEVKSSSSVTPSSSSVVPASSSSSVVVASSSSVKPPKSSSSEVKSSSSSAKSSSSSATSSSSSEVKSSSSDVKSSSSTAKSSSSADGKSSSSKGKDAVVAMGIAPQFSLMTVGRSIQVSAARVGATYAVFDLQGHIMTKGHVGSANFNLKMGQAGTYLVRIGNQTQSVSIK